MDGEKADQPNNRLVNVVTSVGNAWVLCKSKSYSGRVYYFNTLNGKAAWNLSEAEIEKAKNRTSTLASQHGKEIVDCPEPPEPPVDHNQGSRQMKPVENLPTKIYNKQVINNGNIKRPYELSSIAPQSCSHMMSTVTPTSALNAVYPWAIPTPQIFLAPDGSPFLSQPQSTVNLTFKPPEHHLSIESTAVPLPNCFHKLNQSSSLPKNKHKNNIPRRGHNRFGQRRGDSQKNFIRTQFNNSPIDLRQLLSAKRNQELYNLIKMEESKPSASKEKQQECTKNDNEHSDDDSNWLEENMHMQGTTLSLDVTKLIELGKDNASECWYIATDKHILLNHLNFLNILINSDDKCHLLVPREELVELEKAANDVGPQRAVSRARRAIAFLEKRIAADTALISENSTANSKFKDICILNCCTKFSEQNYHVVILSENDALKEFKDAANIPMFTVKEIKKFLTSPFLKPNTPVHDKNKTPLSAIKITIPYRDINIISETSTAKVNEECQTSDDVDTASPSDAHIPTKSTADAEVQTEIPFQIDIPNSKNNVHASLNDPDNHVSSTITDSKPENSDPIVPCQTKDTTIKKGIRLNRSKFHQTMMPSENRQEKKSFKWRRRRNAENTPTKESKRLSSTSDLTNSQSDTTELRIPTGSTVVSISSDNCSTSDAVVPVHTSTDMDQNIDDICLDDTVESETSSYIIKNTLNEKREKVVTIEETSTSGIVSNTSVDSENEHVRQSLSKVFLSESKRESNNMFKVNNLGMEYCLRMRFDEWVSRFFQIMEEVLSQVLRLSPQFVESSIPPPWSLYEACECTKVKFKDNSDVVYHASELMEVVLKFGNMRGEKHFDLNTQEFMKMYSYGVHLVKTLQGFIKNCEDLQTAEESLAKLLIDIENPNVDTSHNDTFSNSLKESLINDTQTSDMPGLKDTTSVTAEHLVINDTKNKCQKADNTKATYNLRTRSRKHVEDKKPTKVKFIRTIDIEAKFFSSLNLQKNGEENKPISLYSGKANKKLLFDKSVKDTEKPRVIRSFIKYPEYEKRLREKQSQDHKNKNYLAYLEHNENGNADILHKYVEDENDKKENNDGNIQENNRNAAVTKSPETVQSPLINHSECKQPPQCTQQVEKLCPILNRHLIHMKETFDKMHAFCKEVQMEITNNPNIADIRKKEIHIKAKTAYNLIVKICQSLRSIVHREIYDPGNNTRAVLNRMGMNNYSDAQFNMYREITVKCEMKANILLKCLKCICLTVANDSA